MTTNEEYPALGRLRPAPLKLSLVIPAYNESARLGAGVSRLRDAVEAGRIDPASTEFVVVDDGSTDATSAGAEALFGPFPHRRFIRLAANRGKGAAVRAGVTAASAPLIAFADADMSIDPAQTPDFVHALATDDLAIGSRAASGAAVDRRSIRRSAMNRTFNRIVNLLTRVALNDTQCGFKAFRAPVAKLLFHCSVTERFAFDVEILSLARRLGLTIAEVPVQWSRVEGSRTRPWLDPGSMTRDVVRARRGAASAPPVPALVVHPDSGLRASPDPAVALKALRQELSPVMPVLSRPDGGLLVMCPLMAESQIEATAERMAAHGTAPPERRVLTVPELVARAPLTLWWDA
ncbi:MAG: dolichyl-phosphate beta-glucosyltransferase [Acidimicrobiales bacterium]